MPGASDVREPQTLSCRWAKERAAEESVWATRMEEAQGRWLRERAQLQRGAEEKQSELAELAAARHDALRGQLESRVAAISERLAELLTKEGKQEAACKKLKEEVGTRNAPVTQGPQGPRIHALGSRRTARPPWADAPPMPLHHLLAHTAAAQGTARVYGGGVPAPHQRGAHAARGGRAVPPRAARQERGDAVAAGAGAPHPAAGRRACRQSR